MISAFVGWPDVEWFGPPRPEGSDEGKTHLQVVMHNFFTIQIPLHMGFCYVTCHPPFFCTATHLLTAGGHLSGHLS